jgi:signal transduction histidine kinase/CheY-like chemotaxis protein
VVLVLATHASAQQQAPAPTAAPVKVLLLHSYDTSSEWALRIGEGVFQGLRDAGVHVDLRQEFLDARRYPGRAYLDRARDLLAAKFEDAPPDVVISCDDAALEFLLGRADLFPGVPVVFGGVQDRTLAALAPRDRFTGIIEQFRIDDVVAAALRVRPATRRVIVTTGNDRNGAAFREEFTSIQGTFPQLSFVSLSGAAMTFPEILQRLRTDTSADDLVMVTPISRDISGQTLEPDAAIQQVVTASRAPVIALAYANFNRGLLAMTANTGHVHGRLMAAKAAQLIAGAAPADVAVQVDGNSPLAFDARQLARWDIAESLLPPGAQLEHRRLPSFYQANQGVIWAAVGFIAVQSAIIGGLVLNVRRRRRAERTLEDQTRALTAANRALEEMNRSLLHEQDVRLQTEEHLRHAQKMEAVGRLAGGIAHDFNNLLTITIGYCELLLKRVPQGTQDREAVQQIRQASEQASTLTQNLLAFSRKQVALPVIVDVVATIRQMEAMLRRFCGDPITLVFDLDDAAAQVRLGQGQLEQILMNLVINGRDAMPNGGRLEVRTHVQALDAEAAASGGWRPGPHAVIVVSDTGVGMDDATRARAFEPFFTTKSVGRGTGLGLATVYGIVTQHGGRIEVDSGPGRGARFTIWLPVAGTPKLADGTTGDDGSGQAGWTVLVVEDEPELLELVARILADAGFTVLRASGGDEAVAIVSSHPGALDLVLTDVVMPGDDGFAVARRVREMRPGVAVAYMSGFTDDGRAGKGESMLRKPFKPADLLAHVRRALGVGAAVGQSYFTARRQAGRICPTAAKKLLQTARLHGTPPRVPGPDAGSLSLALSPPRSSRRWRHGRGASRGRHPPAPRGRDQDPASGGGGITGVAQPVPSRGTPGLGPAAPAHLYHP